MHYQIHHHTQYHYHQAVLLKPQILRLQPRSDGWQSLQQFTLAVNPEPVGRSAINDLDGNCLQRLWFSGPTQELGLTVDSLVETHIDNPFNFLLEPWALQLPFDYPTSLYRQLQPYWQSYGINPDPTAIALAQEIAHDTQRNPLSFLTSLTQRLYQECNYTLREHGNPWEAGITWNSKQGSCRDLTVLFMEVCRAVGLASRFVSGYQEGDQDIADWELHAWAEVYLPGGGWRGYDPTHGLAVSDRHIALVASAVPTYCAPVSGDITPLPLDGKIGQFPPPQMSSTVQVTVQTGTSSQQNQSQTPSLF